MDPLSFISQRKSDHLAIASSKEAAFRGKGTLLDEVNLIHQSLPELHYRTVDLSTKLLGKVLKAPLVISGMTGGTQAAEQINLDLAKAAETLGIGFGLGSQRPMLLDPKVVGSYRVRKVAPNILLLGNLGLMQAKELSSKTIQSLVKEVDADAICLHLNPAMEIIQSEGDRDFRGGIETLVRLKAELDIPLIVKETGCGLSERAGETLKRLGITTVDVSGAGGTSWVGVETLRTHEDGPKQLGQELWDWGIPTAVSVAWMSRLGLTSIATGGLRSGLDVARALALGATAGGLAAPVLKAYQNGGYEEVIAYLTQVIESIRAVTFLTGCTSSSELGKAPKVLGSRLEKWIHEATSEGTR